MIFLGDIVQVKTTKERESYRAVIRQNLPIRSTPCNFLVASVVVVREVVANGGSEWRGWIGMHLYRIPVCLGVDTDS